MSAADILLLTSVAAVRELGAEGYLKTTEIIHGLIKKHAPHVKLAGYGESGGIHTHRFRGPEGRITVVYGHSPEKSIPVGDPLVSEILGDQNEDPEVDPEGGIIRISSFQPLFKFRLHGTRKGAMVSDILGRKVEPMAPDNSITVRHQPIYVIEPYGSGGK